MSRGPRIRDYMATDLVLLRPEMEILHAMRILLDKRISGAPVVNREGALVGVLSKKDCLRAALHASYYQEWASAVSAHMSRKVETLDADLDLISAVKRFLESPYRRFPVTAEGRLVGQISRADLLRALIENWR
jgi:CBS domain-containing protein